MMNNRISTREVAKQFIVAIELLMEWIEQKENSNSKSRNFSIYNKLMLSLYLGAKKYYDKGITIIGIQTLCDLPTRQRVIAQNKKAPVHVHINQLQHLDPNMRLSLGLLL